MCHKCFGVCPSTLLDARETVEAILQHFEDTEPSPEDYYEDSASRSFTKGAYEALYRVLDELEKHLKSATIQIKQDGQDVSVIALRHGRRNK